MDPPHQPTSGVRSWLPRTRGDGPEATAGTGGGDGASPHTRGWTPHHRRHPLPRHGFPAHAGMDPASAIESRTVARLPRTRGDGPIDGEPVCHGGRASPHTRGWTVQSIVDSRPPRGFPAHAGMDLRRSVGADDTIRLPRTRGDGPQCDASGRHESVASPHTRGWTLWLYVKANDWEGFPAHAGMDRGHSHAPSPPSRGNGKQKRDLLAT